MNAKTMVLSAIICGASILGVNMTAAFAEPMTYELQAREISEGVEAQELSQSVRNRNTIIGAVVGAAAIGAIINHNKKHSDSYHDNDYNRDRYDNRRRGDRNAPPPPPMPSHNHR